MILKLLWSFLDLFAFGLIFGVNWVLLKNYKEEAQKQDDLVKGMEDDAPHFINSIYGGLVIAPILFLVFLVAIWF